MNARLALFALAALTLCGCASSEYGYAYCYDPYRGPVGYYTGPFEAKPACASQPVPRAFVRHEVGGYEGSYISGPYPAPVGEAAVDAVSREAVR